MRARLVGQSRAEARSLCLITAEKEQHAQRLLDEGELSQRAIARQARVSRETVNAMATGRRPRDHSLRAAQAKSNQPPPRGPLQRCSCGRLVEMPCHACRVERLVASGQLPRSYPDDPHADDPPLTVALQDEDAQRYLAVRRRKERELLAMTEQAEVQAAAQPFDEEPSDEELKRVERGTKWG